jgi:hypothetical protein
LTSDVWGGVLSVEGNLTAENLIVGSTNLITEITALQSLTATHTEDLATNTADILTKQPLITSSTDLESGSITASSAIVNRYYYKDDDEVKAFGLYGSTLHYYQIEDDLNTFINSGVIEGDTIIFPAGSWAGNILMEDVRSVSFFVGIPNGTIFPGTMDIATTLAGGNRSCRFENITFDGLVVIQGPRMG